MTYTRQLNCLQVDTCKPHTHMWYARVYALQVWKTRHVGRLESSCVVDAGFPRVVFTFHLSCTVWQCALEALQPLFSIHCIFAVCYSALCFPGTWSPSVKLLMTPMTPRTSLCGMLRLELVREHSLEVPPRTGLY